MDRVRVRLVHDGTAPRPDGSEVRFGLQAKNGAMHGGVARGDGLTQFDCELIVDGKSDEGSPDFGGPFVSGSKGERFVYLSWERLNGAGFMNRVKVRLADIDWSLIDAAHGTLLEADLRGAGTGGGSRRVDWRVREA